MKDSKFFACLIPQYESIRHLVVEGLQKVSNQHSLKYERLQGVRYHLQLVEHWHQFVW